jgi:hypothetical protein
VFDVIDELEELRTHTTRWLQGERDELVREQRRLRTKELTILRVLDERGAIEATLAESDGVSNRTAHETLETARALESLPAMAAAAYEGALSAEQLGLPPPRAGRGGEGRPRRVDGSSVRCASVTPAMSQIGDLRVDVPRDAR